MSVDARRPEAASRPHVGIVGAGFAGLACARAFGNAPIRDIVINRHNYHLFVPSPYKAATAALSPDDIAQPIRKLPARYPNVEVTLELGWLLVTMQWMWRYLTYRRGARLMLARRPAQVVRAPSQSQFGAPGHEYLYAGPLFTHQITMEGPASAPKRRTWSNRVTVRPPITCHWNTES